MSSPSVIPLEDGCVHDEEAELGQSARAVGAGVIGPALETFGGQALLASDVLPSEEYEAKLARRDYSAESRLLRRTRYQEEAERRQTARENGQAARELREGILADALRAPGGGSSLAEQCVVAESASGFLVGDIIEADKVQHSQGSDKGIFVDTHSRALFVRKVSRDHAGEFGVIESGRCDFRVLLVAYDNMQKRYGDPKATVDRMRTQVFSDWPVNGPQTALWLLRFMIVRGGTCLGYFDRWLAEAKLNLGSDGMLELQGWCHFFDIAIGYDFLDCGRLACCEVGARRVQMIFDKWKHNMATYGSTGNEMQDDTHLLLGTGETRGNVAMCPELVTWLGGELAKEALAQKERRKAHEERVLAAPKK